MFGASARIEDRTDRVKAAASKGIFRSLGHAIASISKYMKGSIEKSKAPSEPGEAPHTRGRGGHNLKGAIRYDVGKDDAIAGPIASFIGTAGEAHEFGGQYRGTTFQKRPFARPALEANVDRFAAGFAGSIGT